MIQDKANKWKIEDRCPLRTAGSRPHICPVCGGKGHLPSNFYSLGSTPTAINPVTCRTCGGSGIVWEN